jgi:hypothetical protein
MKKICLNAVAIAVGALVAGSAFASVNLDTGTTTVKFAKELDYSAATGTTISGGDVVTTKLGFGVSTGQNRYVRFDFANAAISGTLDGSELTGLSGGSTVTVVQGGQDGDSYVIYQITSGAGDAATETLTFDINATSTLDVPSNSNTPTVTYGLYETAVNAVNKSTALYSANGTLFTFASGLKWNVTTDNNVADVANGFKKFDASTTAITGSNQVALVGTIDYGVNASVKTADGATDVTLADLLTAAKLTVAGDFTAAASTHGLYVDQTGAGTCATTSTDFTLNSGKTSGTITNLGTTAHTYDVCYKVTGSTVIPAETITAAMTPTAAAGATVANVAAATLGTITHNGTELEAPWFSLASGYISRFVLTNNYSADASYTATVTLENGKTCTAGSGQSGTIVAGTTLVIDASTICSAITGGDGSQRASVSFTIAAPNDTIQGVYNIVNPTTGSISVSNLVRPGTN